jgi:hypothetical protein
MGKGRAEQETVEVYILIRRGSQTMGSAPRRRRWAFGVGWRELVI